MTQCLKAPRELTLLPSALNTYFAGTNHELAACIEGSNGRGRQGDFRSWPPKSGHSPFTKRTAASDSEQPAVSYPCRTSAWNSIGLSGDGSLIRGDCARRQRMQAVHDGRALLHPGA